jgi:phosphatidylinositol-3,4,5-trisphosphate 3-phosphatase/dual-specificity protein phosphatase PTEN
MIPQFCDHAAEWLNKDPENIIAVHCKAGKVNSKLTHYLSPPHPKRTIIILTFLLTSLLLLLLLLLLLSTIKGRTGVMISCLLMYMNDFSSAEEAMKFYGEARTHNGAVRYFFIQRLLF